MKLSFTWQISLPYSVWFEIRKWARRVYSISSALAQVARKRTWVEGVQAQGMQGDSGSSTMNNYYKEFF